MDYTMNEYITIDTEKRSVYVRNNVWLPGEDIPKLLQFKTNLVGIEIGVDEGVTSEYLLEKLPECKLYGIDPYMNYFDWSNVEVLGQDEVMPKMLKRMERFGDKFTLIREKSDDAVSKFDDESLDFIFIDGIHTFDQVLKDCRNYWSKLKRGGLFCGHDYTNVAQVGDAVRVYAQEMNVSINRANQDIWYWFKD